MPCRLAYNLRASPVTGGGVMAETRQSNGIPWLGLAALLAVTIVALFLINRVVPEGDECSSDLLMQARGLDLSMKAAGVEAGAKMSPAAQAALTEKLQGYVQASSNLCRMHKAGAISGEEYRIQIAQLNQAVGLLRRAASEGLLSDPNAGKAEIERLLYRALKTRMAGPFILYFDYAKDEVSPEAGEILNMVAENCKEARESGGTPILNITGFSNPAERESNQPLREDRLVSVVDYLRQRGCNVPATINVVDDGSPTIPVLDGVREPILRRVEIDFHNGLY